MAGIHFILGFFLTVFCLGDLALQALAGNSWDISKVSTVQGDVTTLTCTLTGVNFLDIARLTKSHGNGENAETISDKGDVKEKFRDTSRYSVEWEYDRRAKEGKMILTFQGIRGEDAGTIGCSKLGDEDHAVYTHVDVKVPVREVYLARLQPDGFESKLGDGKTVHLREGEELGVTCVAKANGTLTPPALQIIVDDKDVTNMFQSVNKSEKDGNGGFPIHTSEIKLTYLTMDPNHEFHNKELTCKATVPEFPAKTASVFVDIEYGPIISCSKYQHYCKPGASVTFTCDVKANPGSTITWYTGEDRDSAVVLDTEADDSNFKHSESAVAEDHAQVTFTISKVNATMFTKYYLSAVNDIAAREITIELHEGSNKNPPNNPHNSNPGSKSPRENTNPYPQQVKGAATTCQGLQLTTLLVTSVLLCWIQFLL